MCESQSTSRKPNRFGNDHQLLASVIIHGKGTDRTGLHDIAGAFDGLLNVLRISIDAADDDHVLQTTGNVKLAFKQKAKVPGSQKWTFAVSVKALNVRSVASLRW